MVVATTRHAFVAAGWLLPGIARGCTALGAFAGLERLTRAAVVLPFTLVFAIITILAGDLERAGLLLGKSYLSALAVLALVSTTPLPQLLRGLEMLGVPRFLLMVAQFLYRYLFVISEEAQHMRVAAASRRTAAQGSARSPIPRGRRRDGGAVCPILRARRGHPPRHGRARISGTLPPALRAEIRMGRRVVSAGGSRRARGHPPGHRGARMSEPLIEVRDLRFHYEDGTPALNGVNFYLARRRNRRVAGRQRLG